MPVLPNMIPNDSVFFALSVNDIPEPLARATPWVWLSPYQVPFVNLHMENRAFGISYKWNRASISNSILKIKLMLLNDMAYITISLVVGTEVSILLIQNHIIWS